MMGYCGAYAFDGARLVPRIDGAFDPVFSREPQVRDAPFEVDRLCLRAPIGFRGAGDLARERIAEQQRWKRLRSSPNAAPHIGDRWYP